MLSKNKMIVRKADTKSRSSTETIYPPLVYPPLVSVDGDESMRRVREADAGRAERGSPQWAQSLPTSLELLRRLESCVRELIEISTKAR
jgi:hypothetical protein